MSAPDLLLANPAAGGGRTRKLLDVARAALADAGIEPRLVLTEGIEHGRSEARSAARAGAGRVIVMSGDGLIGQVGGELAGTGTALALLPGGRGNDLARVLGIPADIEEAAGIAAAGTTRLIDVGEVIGADGSGGRFLCIASCGFDSVANRLANESRLRGPLVYAWAALRALAGWRAATFTLELDGRTERVTGYSAAACNGNAYGGGMIAAPHAVIDDGLFDVEASGDVGKLRFLRGMAQVFKGEHLETMDVRLWRAAEVRIEADRPFTVYADGDPIAELPATFRVLPRALEVAVPPEGAAA
jgi:YegS/Rv2252/BmrU family lipid kinase